MTSTPEFHERRWAAILVIAAFVVRAAWLLELTTLPWGTQLPTDSFVYDVAARRIAAGDWMLGHDPLRMSPGYFYALGAVHWLFGSGFWAMRVLQAVGGAATVLVTWRLARRITGPRRAILTAALVAFAGPLVFFDGAVLPESASTLAFVVTAWLAARAASGEGRSPTERLGAWAAVGVAVGVSSALRPNAVLLVPALALVAARVSPTRRDGIASAACLALAAALTIAPITARNAAASGRFVPLTSHAGVNLYVGNGPGATGTFRVPPETPGGGTPLTQFDAFREAASRALGRDVDEAEADRYWQERALAHVASDPLAWLVLFARKLHLMFNARELGLVLPYAFSRECTDTMAAPLVQTGWLAPLALVGMLWALMRRRPGGAEDPATEGERAVAVTTVTLVVSVALVFVTDRYRAPLLPLFALHAVQGSGALLEAARARARAHLALLGGATLLAVVLAVPVRANQHFEREWLGLGLGFLEGEQPARGLDAFDHALALEPGLVEARRGRAYALEALGRASEASAVWSELAQDPSVADEAQRALERLGASGR